MATSVSVWPVVSRFARPRAAPVRTWAPPESPLRIEYSPALLREVGMAGETVDASGLLYGVRDGHVIRVAATRARAGLRPVGVFASRPRGQVFLTEEDLEKFEKAEALVALVISGSRGGFFVRDAAGSIETVRSYQEFSFYAPAPAAAKRKRIWAWCLALFPLFYLVPRPPPLAIKLSEDAGQLRISWNRPAPSTLTIRDGGRETAISIDPRQSSVTYARRTGDVAISMGAAHARFVGPAPPMGDMERMRASIAELARRVTALRAARAAGKHKVAALLRRLQ